jgi:hypothetical protein
MKIDAIKNLIISFDIGRGAKGTVEFGVDVTIVRFSNGHKFSPIYLGKIDEYVGSSASFTVKNGKVILEVF